MKKQITKIIGDNHFESIELPNVSENQTYELYTCEGDVYVIIDGIEDINFDEIDQKTQKIIYNQFLKIYEK